MSLRQIFFSFITIVTFAFSGGPAEALWNSSHATGPIAYDGVWDLHDPAINELDLYRDEYLPEEHFTYRPLSRANYGTTLLLIPNAQGGFTPLQERVPAGTAPREMYVRELHYPLYRRENGDSILYPTENQRRRYDVGQRIIPVVNGHYTKLENAPTGQAASGETIRGSEEIDALLRQVFASMKNGRADYDAANPDSPIFTLASYSRPLSYIVSLRGLSSEGTYKVQGGLSHLGIYLGRGQTRNAPIEYRERTWEVSNVPALIHTIEFEGAEPKYFNRNAVIATKVLNELNGGPSFAENYEFDHYRAFSLREVLDFYRAWIDVAWVRDQDKVENGGDGKPFYEKLRSSPSWATYCAEHVVLAVNVAVNVAHNKRGFQDIWGEQEGAALWALLQQRWLNDNKLPQIPAEPDWVSEWFRWREWRDVVVEIRGRGWPDAPPPETGGIWENLTLEQAIPEGDNFFKPLWKLDGIRNPRAITIPGRSLAFPAQSTADLLNQFVRQYADWSIVGPVFSATIILGFMDEVKRRTGVSEERFAQLSLSIVAEMFKSQLALDLAKVIASGRISLPADADARDQVLAQFLGVALPQYLAGLKMVGVPEHIGQTILALANQPITIAGRAEAWARQPDEALRVNWARDQFERSARPYFIEAQREPVALSIEEQEIAGVQYVQYYTPPAIMLQLSLGNFPSHQRVRFATVASVFGAESVTRASGSTRRFVCPYLNHVSDGAACVPGGNP